MNVGKKFCKKPIVIDAWQWCGGNYADVDGPEWLFEGFRSKDIEIRSSWGSNSMFIRTLEGEMLANPGDWIIRGVKGELYPCKPDIFEITYESVER